MRLILLIMLFSIWSMFAQTSDTPGPKLPPEVAAEVKTLEETVAKALSSLTSKLVAQEALPAAERAYQLRRQYQGDEWWETMDRSIRLDVLRRASSLPTESEKLLEEAFRLEKQAGSVQDPLTREKALQQLAAVEATLYGEGSIWRANSLTMLANNLDFQMKYGEAEALYREALAIQVRATGKQHPNYAAELNALARNLRRQGRYVEVESLLREELGIQERLRGMQHSDYVETLGNLASNLQTQKKYEDAEAVIRKALRIQERLTGKQHSMYLQYLSELTANLKTQGKREELEPIYRESLGIQERVTGKKHSTYVETLSLLAINLDYQLRHSEAEVLLREALVLEEAVSGKWHRDYAISLTNLAIILSNQEKYAEAELLYREALGIQERLDGKEHTSYSSRLMNLGRSLDNQGKHAEAEVLYREALEIQERTTGKLHPSYSRSLNDLTRSLNNQRKYAEAELLYREALSVQEQATGKLHPNYSKSLSDLTSNLNNQKKYAEAEVLYREALRAQEQATGKLHPNYSKSLSDLTGNLNNQKKYAEAEVLYREALGIQEQATGKLHPNYSRSLSDLTGNLNNQKKYAEAEVLYREALGIQEQATGKLDPNYSESLRNLADNLNSQRKYAEAELLYRDALGIQEQATGKLDPSYLMVLSKLASNLKTQGKHGEADSLNREAKVIEAKLDLDSDSGSNLFAANILRQNGEYAASELRYREFLRITDRQHPIYLAALLGLASDLRYDRKYEEAELLFRESLGIQEEITGKQNLSYAKKLRNVALTLTDQKHYAEAEQLFLESLQIQERMTRRQGPDYAETLAELAELFLAKGKFGEAEQLFRKSLRILDLETGKQHEFYSQTLVALGKLCDVQEKYSEAEQLFRESLQIQESMTGELGRDYVLTLDALAWNLNKQRRYREAERMFREAMGILKKRTTNLNAGYYTVLTSLAFNLASDPARHSEALELFLKAARNQRQFVASQVMMTADGQRKLGEKVEEAPFLLPSTLKWNLNSEERMQVVEELLLSFAQSSDRDLQANATLQRVQRTAPVWWQKTWEEHVGLRRAIAARALRGMYSEQPGETPLKVLFEKTNLLEKRMRGYQPFEELARLENVGLTGIAQPLKVAHIAVQLSLYIPVDFAADPPKRWGEAAYMALLLRSEHEPVHVSLGSKAIIEAAVRELQRVHRACIDGTKVENAAISEEWWQDCEKKVAAAGSRVRELVWDPLKEHLKDSRRVYIAAGGMLGLVPFEMLPAKQAGGSIRYLVEDREFVYLNSLRELATLSRRRDLATNQTAVVVANPRYDATPMELAQTTRARDDTQAMAKTNRGTLGASILTGGDVRMNLPRDWPAIDVAPLVETSVESLKKNNWNVEILMGSDATEEKVMAVKAPRLLQIATHGYVLDPPKDQPEQSPLLRSMLMLAGVNKSAKGAGVYRIGQDYLSEEEARARNISDEDLSKAKIDLGDGVLTAYEAQGMDLFGTELVNLTACETGLGAVNADGIAGLRQAFMNAGARSITMSLFEILQLESTKQMAQFYENWLGQKMTRYNAFRAAQLQALESARKNEKTGHPFFWAGIVFAGDPGDLPSIAK
jgi:tetratricopeptide (TPR) repeat protein/CHAT domain-containing protein